MRMAIFTVLLFSGVGLLAQRESIVSFTDKLVVTGVLNTKSEDFEFSNDLDQTIEYSTAPITGLGFGIDYKWFTFEYTRRLNSRTNDGLYGHTENFGIGFGFTMPRWYFKNFFETYTGYHITNPDLVQIGYLDSVGSYPYRPDISTSRYFASFNWVFNHNTYSSMASLWQLERQEKSAGSFVLGATFSAGVVLADSSFIPGVQQDNFDQVSDWNGVLRRAFTINTGYQYTFVLSDSKKWFLHIGLNPGFGTVHTEVRSGQTDEIESLTREFAFTTEGRLNLGYNGDEWYCGLTSIGYGTYSGGEYVGQGSFNSYTRLYLGYRFTLPQKTVDFLEKIWL